MMEKFISEHAYLWYFANTALIVLTAWAIKRLIGDAAATLAKACKSIDDLYAKYNDHEHRLSHIEGEHSVFSKLGNHGGQ